MSRSVPVSVQSAQKFTDWPIVGNRIRNWSNTLEGVRAILLRPELASAIGTLLVGIFKIVNSVSIGLPHINQGLGHSVTFDIADVASNKGALAKGALGSNGVACADNVGVLVMERTQDGGLCGARLVRV
jgi:hypothetical protein